MQNFLDKNVNSFSPANLYGEDAKQGCLKICSPIRKPFQGNPVLQFSILLSANIPAGCDTAFSYNYNHDYKSLLKYLHSAPTLTRSSSAV